MITHIITTEDFLYHAPNQRWLFDLLAPVLSEATGLTPTLLADAANATGETFSRETFFSLSGVSNPSKTHFAYDAAAISQASLDYLGQFVGSHTLVIGFELGEDLRRILNGLNARFLNFWAHSWKLFDDFFFMINADNEAVFEKIRRYMVPREKFLFYANYWKTFADSHGGLGDEELMDNSVVFVGQTMRDKAIDDNGKHLNILDFRDEMEKLSQRYSKIYYIPHPYCHDAPSELDDYLSDTDYIEVLEGHSTYHLLMSDKIRLAVGVSSSVLYEADFFGKETRYLFKSLFDIDGAFGDNTFISVYNDYFNPMFWSEILSPIMETKRNVHNEVYFFDMRNKVRNIRDVYYGYSHFDPLKRLEKQTEASLRGLQFKVEKSTLYSKMALYTILHIVTRSDYFKKKLDKTAAKIPRSNH